MRDSQSIYSRYHKSSKYEIIIFIRSEYDQHFSVLHTSQFQISLNAADNDCMVTIFEAISQLTLPTAQSAPIYADE
jgi:hypothetical protein